MILKVYLIYDNGIEAYLQPFYARNKGEALRSVTDLVNDPKHHFCQHAKDYTLFEVGEYDDKAGVVQMYTAKDSIANFVELKKTEQN